MLQLPRINNYWLPEGSEGQACLKQDCPTTEHAHPTRWHAEQDLDLDSIVHSAKGKSMLERGHTEFVQAQMLPWRRIGQGLARPDAEFKLLSQDATDGACSVLMRYPPGWSREGPEHICADEEFYVLDGSLEMDGRHYAADHYAFLPAGWTRQTMRSRNGCVLLAFYNREPGLIPHAGSLSAADEARCIPQIDVTQMPWDMTLNDPNLRHLGIGRKNLRTDPISGERTFLSIILPQAVPPGFKGPQETHPTVEESWLLSGSLTGPHGTMYPGAYFWRPPGIPHGPFGARWGAVSLMRFVGGQHVNQWSQQDAPFSFDAPYKPVLPPELEHLADQPWQQAPSW